MEDFSQNRNFRRYVNLKFRKPEFNRREVGVLPRQVRGLPQTQLDSEQTELKMSQKLKLCCNS
jgi:hypothetical protein